MSKLATEPSSFRKLAIGHLYDGVIYLNSTIKVHFIITFIFKLEISARIKTAEALIYTTKQNTEAFW